MPVPAWLSRIPAPSHSLLRALALLTATLQGVIMVAGAVVRVTGSGLGCPTWPECFPGSMVPVSHANVALLNQWIEYGNRMFSGFLGILTFVVFVAVWRASTRQRRTFWLAFAALVGVGVQAVVGGVTVHLSLTWWIVCVHLLLSPPLVWLSVLLVRALREEQRPGEATLLPKPLRALLAANGVVLTALLIAGTLVTAAGPHAGDPKTPRLDVPIATLAQLHADLMFLYLGMLVALGFALRAVGARRADWKQYWTLLVLVLAQGALGMVQYWTGVPEVLVMLHVLGAAVVIAATAAMWAGSRTRLDPAGLPEQTSESRPADAVA